MDFLSLTVYNEAEMSWLANVLQTTAAVVLWYVYSECCCYYSAGVHIS